ncbi:MAG: type II toxin-antitoxin system HicA family toxin [Desulfobacterales bacterium]
MPPFRPVKRKELIRYLKRLEFQGPYSGGKHQFMIRGEITISIPNPHQTEIGRNYLAKILRQAGISKEEWEKL